ncbi:molybdenum ABC transporter ATP-binding protein [Aureimonas altamirensis]|uniref:molybdenum ABC transporter ATP-binding protein n=1 Tax=Aureimonas altamirensis TaxID=370622 RepID=UPI00203702C4|nr:molybdenum ABC transporter ATP-binding protein [Aureimonas altamirensis]MCM2502633.1 molybdenum ABC transporter ATP-binding protein [Aureimonas altamirensis]
MDDRIVAALAGRLGSFTLDVDFALPMHGISALFGPSGCGKTTILRCIAGLNRLAGAVRVGPDLWQDGQSFVPTHRRPIGYVFQEASLFPHLSVRQNLVYGAKRSKRARHSIAFDEVVALLGLAPLMERAPTHLSGGERQRVSLGRALLRQPSLLLMDEPLSALDRTAKEEILPYFEALHANLRIPMILVTHDMSEVERLADHLVLLRDGRVVSGGPLEDALSDPASPLAAKADFASVLIGRVQAIEADGIAAVDVGGATIRTVGRAAEAGMTVRVRVAAGDVSIVRSPAKDTSILNALPARVVGIDPIGEFERSIRLQLDPGGAFIRSRITARSVKALNLSVGEAVFAQVKSVSIVASR